MTMHSTKITREQVYRAVMLREQFVAISPPAAELLDTDQERYNRIEGDYEERYHAADLASSHAMGEILNILADEMGIDIQAIRHR